LQGNSTELNVLLGTVYNYITMTRCLFVSMGGHSHYNIIFYLWFKIF